MLTGLSAAALYGSDAANGVVLINTKRGAEGKTTVTISNTAMFLEGLHHARDAEPLRHQQYDLQLG